MKEDQTRESLSENGDRLASDIKQVFEHPRAGTLLAWLADTCCATESVFDENPFVMAAAEGRRQVWVALNQILSLSHADVNEIREQVIAWKREASQGGSGHYV